MKLITSLLTIATITAAAMAPAQAAPATGKRRTCWNRASAVFVASARSTYDAQILSRANAACLRLPV